MTRQCLEALTAHLAVSSQHGTFLFPPATASLLEVGTYKQEQERPQDPPTHCFLDVCNCPCVSVYMFVYVCPSQHVPVCVHFHLHLRLCAPTSEREQTYLRSGSEWGFLWPPPHSLLSRRLLPGVGTRLMLRSQWLRPTATPWVPHAGAQPAPALRCLQGILSGDRFGQEWPGRRDRAAGPLGLSSARLPQARWARARLCHLRRGRLLPIPARPPRHPTTVR